MSEADPVSVPVPAFPVAALPYSFATDQRRPGIITAIGVLCITVAALSVLSSLMEGGYSVLFYVISKSQGMATRYVTTSVPATPAAPAQSPALPGGDASVAVNALDSMLSLDNAHLRELDRLLRRHGRQVFGGDDDTPLTSAAVRAAVMQSTPLSAGVGEAAFSTAQGTVDIYSDRAGFKSADGVTTVETSARLNRDQETTANSSTTAATYSASVSSSVVAGTPPVSTPTALTGAQIKAVISSAQRFGTPINNAQLQALRAELAKPNQVLTSGTSLSPVLGVVTQPSGNQVITFDTSSMLILDPKGKVILSGPMPMPHFDVSGTLATVNALEAVASIGLAIYLLIVGILVLRGSFSSPRLLRIYALIKIPLAIVAGIGLTLLGYAIANASANNVVMGTSGASTNAKLGFVIFGVFAILLGLALPVGILIALRTKTVRNYYNSIVPSPERAEGSS